MPLLALGLGWVRELGDGGPSSTPITNGGEDDDGNSKTIVTLMDGGCGDNDNVHWWVGDGGDSHDDDNDTHIPYPDIEGDVNDNDNIQLGRSNDDIFTH